MCLRHDALGRLTLVGETTPWWFVAGGIACDTDFWVSNVYKRFKYDARNRRVARQVGGQWTYVVSNESGQPLSELALINGAWIAVRDYVWLDGTLLAQIERSGPQQFTYYAHTDHLGTPRALTNSNAQVVWSTFLLPYGEVREKTTTDPLSGKSVVTNLRLPGQYDERLLGSLGLQGPYYNWNRWYLPGVGRYLEPDPIALAGGFNGEFGPDWYGYGNQNPLSSIDPEGLSGSRPGGPYLPPDNVP